MIQPQKADERSLDTLLTWIDSPEMLMQFGGPAFIYPLTKEQIQTSLNNQNIHAFEFIDSTTGNMVAYAEVHLTAEGTKLGRIIVGDTNMRGKGIGQTIVQYLLHVSFNELNREHTELNVFDWNTSAIKCYEKAGFTVNPNKRFERIVNGKTWTALNMVLDKQHWIPLQSFTTNASV